MKKICMFLTNSIDHDSRVINEAEALSEKYRVTILISDNNPTALKNKSFKIKIINFKESKFFPLQMFRMVQALNKAAKKEECDFYHAHDLDGLMAGFRAAKKNKKPLIYDSHELFYDLPEFSNIKGFHHFIRFIERYLVKKITAGITVSDTISLFLKKLYEKEFTVIRNIPLLSEAKKPSVSLRKMFPNRKIILHIGGTGKLRGTGQLVKAVQYLPKNYVVVFLGAKENDPLLSDIKLLKIKDRAVLIPSVPPDEVIAVAKEADLGVSLTQNASLDYYFSLPNKLFQYIGAELPIIGSDFPEFKKIIVGELIGEVVDPSKPKLIAKKIIKMMNKPTWLKYKKNLKGLARKKYDWKIESKKLLDFYHDLIN